MRRKAAVLFMLILFIVPLFPAEIPKTNRRTFYLRGTVSPSYATEKVYSYPAKNGNIHALLGVDIAADIYKNDESAKTGLSTDIYVSYPLLSKKYVNFSGEDVSSGKPVLHASAGAVFRCTPSDYLDASIALRLGVLSYDAFTEGIIVTATVEPRVDYFLSDSMFITGAISVTNGFIKFTPGHAETWYENNYTSVLCRIELGMGWKIGGDRKR
jgi:hypothetical protein